MICYKFRVLLLIILILSNSTLSNAFQPVLNKSTIRDENYSDLIANFYELKSAKKLVLLKIKGYQQTEDYTCGPASVMSLMHYYDMLKDEEMNKKTELRISKEMGTSKIKGTSPKQMGAWLKRHGFKVQSGENGTIGMLQQNLKKGIPTLVEWIDWGGHWVIVAGYNAEGKSPSEDKDTIFFADPSAHFDNVKHINGITPFNPDRFTAMWFDAQYFNPGHLIKGIYIIAVPQTAH
jgi:predicted double-glycine peptidase